MKRTQLKRKSKTPLAKLKVRLWQLCREISIKRHGNTCYCCGAMGLMGSNLHLGHFIPSSVCSTELRYSLDNLRPSCYRCNIHLSGNWLAYEQHLTVDGIDVEALKKRNRDTVGMKGDVLWFNSQIAEYEVLVRNGDTLYK